MAAGDPDWGLNGPPYWRVADLTKRPKDGDTQRASPHGGNLYNEESLLLCLRDNLILPILSKQAGPDATPMVFLQYTEMFDLVLSRELC